MNQWSSWKQIKWLIHTHNLAQILFSSYLTNNWLNMHSCYYFFSHAPDFAETRRPERYGWFCCLGRGRPKHCHTILHVSEHVDSCRLSLSAALVVGIGSTFWGTISPSSSPHVCLGTSHKWPPHTFGSPWSPLPFASVPVSHFICDIVCQCPPPHCGSHLWMVPWRGVKGQSVSTHAAVVIIDSKVQPSSCQCASQELQLIAFLQAPTCTPESARATTLKSLYLTPG